ncbi:MAG: hypothetical protein ACUVRY_05045 [Thermoanaerobaculaceae bacterium]
MRQMLFLLWPVGLLLVGCALALLDRRDIGDLGPLVLAFVFGAVGAGFWGWRGLDFFAFRQGKEVLALANLPLAVWGLMVTLLSARWPWAETPLDFTWVGMAAGSGLSFGMALAQALGEAQLEFWLVATGPVLGSCGATVWGWNFYSPRRWQRFGAFLVAPLVSLGIVTTVIWLGRRFSNLLAGSLGLVFWLLLAVAVGMVLEARELKEQLAEEARFGFLPWAAVEACAKWHRRLGKTLAGRRSERRALARVLVRLAALKAYLGSRRKNKSAASIELGKLREWVKRAFSPPGNGGELAPFA